jgi:hypothetical protein
MIYNSNFDSTEFENLKYREFNNIRDDPCYIQQTIGDNNKKLKFITTNHRDLINAKEQLNFYGMTMKDQLFVPADKIDTYSLLRQGQNGNILTNCNLKNEYGQLPFPTMPSKYQLYHGDTDIEYSLQTNNVEANRKTCNPRESHFYNRSFYIFDGIETPDPLKSVEEFNRVGISTRFKN